MGARIAFKCWLLLMVVPGIVVLDQLTKWAVVARMEVGARITIIPGCFDLVHFRNTGAAFGMLAGTAEGFRVPFFYAIAIAATVVLALLFRSLGVRERLLPFALSLVFGGIAGNILDRLWRGSVVDFLSFHVGERALDFGLWGRPVHVALEWPAFNVADSAITVAMLLIIFSALRRRRGVSEADSPRR